MKNWVIILAIVIVLAIIGVVVYFVFRKKTEKKIRDSLKDIDWSNIFKPVPEEPKDEEPDEKSEGFQPGIGNQFSPDAWTLEIQNEGIGPSTVASHKAWSKDLRSRTTGSSVRTVLDHDKNSNWRGLGTTKTYQSVYAAPGARVTESNDPGTMPANPHVRWRTATYLTDEPDPKQYYGLNT